MDRTAPESAPSQRAKSPLAIASVKVSRLQQGWLSVMGVDAPWIAVRPDPQPSAQDESRPTPSSEADVSGSKTASPLASAIVPERNTQGSQAAQSVKAAKPEALIAPVDVAGLSLAELSQAVATCKGCALCETRRHAVTGDGVVKPTILIVGEAPGEQEDEQGKPFVGRSGELLDNMLKAIGHGRQTTAYITNVVKCRPPANRNPRDEEIAACASYLERQLQLLKPAAILAMGRFAAHALLRTDQPLQALRQTEQSRQVGADEIPVVVTYHPAYLLRRPADKRLAWEDLKRLTRLVAERS